jgi:osmotically-inducible protein OsmY
MRFAAGNRASPPNVVDLHQDDDSAQVVSAGHPATLTQYKQSTAETTTGAHAAVRRVLNMGALSSSLGKTNSNDLLRMSKHPRMSSDASAPLFEPLLGDTYMKTDADIRRDVELELQWDPSVDDKHIGVIVNDGIVTLAGEVPHYSGRWAAEDVAKRVIGVRAIANELKVSMPLTGVRTDTDIAEAAANAMRWNVAISDTQIKPVVQDGWITLSGKVSFGFQRTSAENAVRYLMGVKGVTNNIVVTSAIKAGDVKQKIEDAFKRQAVLDAEHIEVKVDRSTVTLKGHVHTWQEHDDAARAAWGAPGVANVENRLTIQ